MTWQVALDDVAEDLVSMGIEAPVTKASAGKHFDMQLAREVRLTVLFPLLSESPLPS